MKKEKKEKSKYWFYLKVAIAIFLIFKFIIWFTPIYESSIVYDNYECDGRNIEDECSTAQIKFAGVLIKNCKSGREYFCQSVFEVPIIEKTPIVEDRDEQGVYFECIDSCYEYFDVFEPDFDTCWDICSENKQSGGRK